MLMLRPGAHLLRPYIDNTARARYIRWTIY